MESVVKVKLEEINNILREKTPEIKNPGLLHGKMGVSLYFFHLAHETDAPEHKEFADQLIDEVYDEVSNNQLPPDFENGLAGIAWGIEHLVQHEFVEAETDLILRDVDDRIYRFVTSGSELPWNVKQGVMGYILYLLSRLHGKDLNSVDGTTMIFKHLLIDLINRLGEDIEENKLSVQEPNLFDITWQLPLSLVLLSRCYAANVHITKIERILDHFTPVMLSLYPRYCCHRLYLLYAIESVLQQISLPKWKEHAVLLKQGMYIDRLLNDELNSKQIRFRDGTAGVLFINRQYYQITEEPSILLQRDELIQKFMKSEYWEWMDNHASDQKNIGIFTGLSGVAMMLLELLKKQPVEAGTF